MIFVLSVNWDIWSIFLMKNSNVSLTHPSLCNVGSHSELSWTWRIWILKLLHGPHEVVIHEFPRPVRIGSGMSSRNTRGSIKKIKNLGEGWNPGNLGIWESRDFTPFLTLLFNLTLPNSRERCEIYGFLDSQIPRISSYRNVIVFSWSIWGLLWFANHPSQARVVSSHSQIVLEETITLLGKKFHRKIGFSVV